MTLLWHSCYSTTALPSTRVQPYRQLQNHQTPFAVHIGMSVFVRIRKGRLISVLHVAFQMRVLDISSNVEAAVVTQYVEDGIIFPSLLQKQLFTSSAVDNIDHNRIMIMLTARTSSHGTRNSIFHHSNSDNVGEKRGQLKVNAGTGVKKVPVSPEAFTKI